MLTVLLLLPVFQSHSTVKQSQAPYLHAPSVTTYAKHDPEGTTILSNGRHLTPLGKSYPIPRAPHGLAMTIDGRNLFLASENKGTFVDDWQSDSPKLIPVTPQHGGNAEAKNSGGVAFSPNGKRLYWSSGDGEGVYVWDAEKHTQLSEISIDGEIDGKKYSDSFVNDLQVSADGKYVYCADVTNFRLVIIDTAEAKVVGSVPVGRLPYALTVVGNRAYVANIGLFQYTAVPPLSPEDEAKAKQLRKTSAGPVPDSRGLSFPPFGFPSKESRDGVTMEGRRIAGLGEPNVWESFSVWGVDVSNPTSPKVIAKIKTGLLLGAPADRGMTVGGSAPNYVVARGNSLWVSNGNNDIIERIDITTGKVVLQRRIQPSPLTAKLRGISPAGMVLSPDGKRLYVTEMAINGVAVLDSTSLQVIGHIPTAWYPYRVTVSPSGDKLGVICFRGFGDGPRGGSFVPQSQFLGMKGVFTTLSLPNDQQLAVQTRRVLENNGLVNKAADRPTMTSKVVPTTPGKASDQIKYVVFITKENHTYDAIFDRIPGAKHDPTLLRWGLHQKISAPGQPTLEDVAVMTNHNALARQFTVSDNFYMEPEASGVGHRWLVGVQPNNLMQLTYTAGWKFKKNTTAPGRLYSMGSNGSLIPEDYPEAGSMWEHLARNGKTFRNYGEGFEFPGVGEDEDEHPTGAREVVNIPMPKVLFDNTCREFPIFNMNIPDQYRAHWFAKDFEKLFVKGKSPMPSFVNIAICNDHGSGTRPNKGYPYLASWMADNDLALGRIVDYLSHTKYWKNMAIFVTQDDSGGENDHVDKLRSVLLAIGPWIKKGYVSHTHTTITSMHRTLYQLLGLPALNMFDALANDFSDCFTDKPDFTPYDCKPVDPRIFDPEKAKNPKDPEYKDAIKQASLKRDTKEAEEYILSLGGTEPVKPK